MSTAGNHLHQRVCGCTSGGKYSGVPTNSGPFSFGSLISLAVPKSTSSTRPLSGDCSMTFSGFKSLQDRRRVHIHTHNG